MTEERVYLTYEQAVERLPEGDRVHVFTQYLMGADWDRQAVLDMLQKAVIEESGRRATAMGHGLAAWDSPRHCWLVETIEASREEGGA